MITNAIVLLLIFLPLAANSAAMTVEEAKAKHHAYIACIKIHPIKQCDAKYHVKSR